ncbi:hypothetical protein F7725_023604 [Dissostichus mawsoni]|uniref:Kinesin motor domain-containing protein n=1 Tax=Dissostichus mawsoni TaxID=36200 RepID=A0A7J5XXU5_DISMA|nr:hypothetical protein F7725_023604 [Dissostichus mawsoni]
MESCLNTKAERRDQVQVEDLRRDLLSEFSTLPYPQDCVTIERPDTALLKPPNPPPSARLSSDKALPQTGQRFQFSQVYGPETSQKELFQGTVKDLVKDVLEGGNSLVFTYGVQMLMLAFCPAPWMLSSAASMSRCSTGRASNLSDAESSPDSPRSSRRRKPPSRDTSSDNLKRHLHDGYFRGEDQSGSGRTHKVLCLDFFLHSIFSIRILRIEDIGTMRVHAVSELCLCDLAGSERCAKTQNKGERLKEAGNINTSLLILGKCLNALRHNQQAKLLQHVPFRESKLTHYLQGFFCGRGKACMIVNINQCASMYDETLNVLKFSAVAQKEESARQPEELLIGWDSSLEDVQVVQLQVQLKKERAENLLMEAREERRGREEAITALEIQTTGREEALASLQKEIGVNKKLLESERRAKDKAAAELSEESKQRMEVVASLCRERRVRQEAEIRLEEERKEVRRLMEERETLQQEVREKTSRLETSEQQVGNTVTNVMVRTTETLEQNRKDLQQKTSQVLTLTQEVQSLKQEVQTSATSDDQLREEEEPGRGKGDNEKEMLELEEDLDKQKNKTAASQQEAALKQQIEDLKKQRCFQQPPEEAHDAEDVKQLREKLEEHILASKELNESCENRKWNPKSTWMNVQETTFCSTVKDLKLKLSEQLEGAKLTESDISSSSSSSSSSAAAAEEDLKRLNSVLQTEITSLKQRTESQLLEKQMEEKQLEEKLAAVTKVSAEREADLEKQLQEKETDLEKQLEEKLAACPQRESRSGETAGGKGDRSEKQLEEKETDLEKQLEEKLAAVTKVSAEREADLEKQLEEKLAEMTKVSAEMVKQLEEKLAEMTKVSAEREADLEKQLEEKETDLTKRKHQAGLGQVKSLSVDLRRKRTTRQTQRKTISSMREEEKLSKQKLTDIEKSKRQLQSDIASRDRTIQTLRVVKNTPLFQKTPTFLKDLEATQRVMEDMRLALTEQEETQEQMETVLEEKLNVIQELSSGMLLQQDRRGNNAHDQSTGQSDDLKQAKQEVAQSQERFKESLSSQLAEKEQLMEKWRKERDTLVSALEVQLQKLLSSQSADGEGVMAELQAALSERDSEILRLKEELEAANTKQEETQTKTTESESPATLVGKPQSEGIKRKSGGGTKDCPSAARMSRFPRPEMEISFSSLQPNRMALRRQGEENSVTVKITRRSKRRTTRKEEVEVENTRSKATPKLTAYKEEFTSQFFCRNTTRDTQGQTSEFLPESFSQQSSEVWESNDGLEENPETKEEQKETVQT